MTQDYNKKTVRQFQCRDYLWEIFEQMGSELECSVDYLLNEAMRQYARSRSQRAAGSAPAAPPPTTAPRPAPAGPVSSAPMGRPTAVANNTTGRPPARSSGGVPKPPPPVPTGGSMAPPPLPTAQPQPAASTGGMPPLHVIFNGQKIPVRKEEFVIGRGSKTADLPIKDGNISRRHAAVVWQDGAFFMKDLGSTNGIEFHGERVSTKRIEEGDVFQLCDYELRFTYS